jgi:hypothetical protein
VRLGLNEPMSRDYGLSLLDKNLNNRVHLFYHLLSAQRSRYRLYIFTRSKRCMSFSQHHPSRCNQSRRFGMCGSRKLSQKQFLNRNKNNSPNNSETIPRTIRSPNSYRILWNLSIRLHKTMNRHTRKKGKLGAKGSMKSLEIMGKSRSKRWYYSAILKVGIGRG